MGQIAVVDMLLGEFDRAKGALDAAERRFVRIEEGAPWRSDPSPRGRYSSSSCSRQGRCPLRRGAYADAEARFANALRILEAMRGDRQRAAAARSDAESDGKPAPTPWIDRSELIVQLYQCELALAKGEVRACE